MKLTLKTTLLNRARNALALTVMGVLAVFSYSASLVAQNDERSIPVPVSINALMVTLIDHSAHYIWDYSVMEREISADEWRTIEYYAIQLAGSGPLITLGGSGSLDNTWADSDAWTSYSRTMTNAAMLALDAAKNKDQGLLATSGNVLVASCEGCHDAFKPGTPTEGITHAPDYDYLYHLFER